MKLIISLMATVLLLSAVVVAGTVGHTGAALAQCRPHSGQGC